MIRCECGMCIDDDVGRVTCPRCGKQFPIEDYRAAHIPARPETDTDRATSQRMGHCPDCGMDLVREEGCQKCMLCGWSACG